MAQSRFFANNAPQQELAGGIGSSQTTLQVNSFAGWPTSYPYAATLDYGTASEEVVLVTGVTGVTATVQRGYDGTTAVSHLAAATLDHTVIAKDLNEANAHVNATSGVHGASGIIADLSSVQTFSNKTYASPVFTGSLNGPTATIGGSFNAASASVSGLVNAGTLNSTGAIGAVGNIATAAGVVSGAVIAGIVRPQRYADQLAAGTGQQLGSLAFLTAPIQNFPPGLFYFDSVNWVPVGATYMSGFTFGTDFSGSGSEAFSYGINNYALTINHVYRITSRFYVSHSTDNGRGVVSTRIGLSSAGVITSSSTQVAVASTTHPVANLGDTLTLSGYFTAPATANFNIATGLQASSGSEIIQGSLQTSRVDIEFIK